MADLKVRPGSRVYWHGVFPDLAKQGTVIRTGEIRHEVLWDGAEEPTLVLEATLAKIVGGKPQCRRKPRCGYCEPA